MRVVLTSRLMMSRAVSVLLLPLWFSSSLAAVLLVLLLLAAMLFTMAFKYDMNSFPSFG